MNIEIPKSRHFVKHYSEILLKEIEASIPNSTHSKRHLLKIRNVVIEKNTLKGNGAIKISLWSHRNSSPHYH